MENMWEQSERCRMVVWRCDWQNEAARVTINGSGSGAEDVRGEGNGLGRRKVVRVVIVVGVEQGRLGGSANLCLHGFSRVSALASWPSTQL